MSPRVHQEWARRVAAEYTSAALSAQVLTWAIQAGLDPDLLLLAHRVVKDELDHARLSHEVLVALGGEAEPVDLDGPGLLVRDAFPEALVRGFCLGESFAVPYFAAMRERATHPAVRPVLDRILEDEAVHRAFGWRCLDALIEREPALTARLAAALPGLLAGFGAYRDPPPAPALTDEERACGLLDHAEYAALYARTWADDLGPRFARRGM